MGMSDMEDALGFWARNTGDLPLLSAMARVYLALSPGSVPVEQLFSTAHWRHQLWGTGACAPPPGAWTCKKNWQFLR